MPSAGRGSTARLSSTQEMLEIRGRIRSDVEDMGFRLADVTRIVTASSELMRNILEYAGQGEVSWRRIDEAAVGVELVFLDDGPGIGELTEALESGVSSGRGLGMGLPGTRRLMDEMEIESKPQQGTRVVVRKWLART